MVAGLVGLVGDTMGKKRDGVLLILGAVLTLIGVNIFVVLPFFLMLVGGVLALA